MAEWKNGDEDEDSEAESITLDIFGELCVLVLGYATLQSQGKPGLTFAVQTIIRD